MRRSPDLAAAPDETHEPWGVPRTTDVVVIGGGLVGTAAAYYLATAGLEVVLLERRELNREASGTNAGSLHFQILRQPSWEEAWLERIRPSLILHAAAIREWAGLEAQLGYDLGVRLHGGLMVAETAAEVETLKRKAAIERSLGIASEVLAASEVQRMIPALSDRIVGADFLATEGHANPLLVALAFAAGARQAGAQVETGAEVRAIDRQGTRRFLVQTARGQVRARRVVCAAGAWSGEIARLAGLDLPIGGDVLHMNVTESVVPRLDHLVQHVGRRLTLKQVETGNFLIGGGWPGGYERARNRALVERESVEGSLWIASQIVPSIGAMRLIRTWAGVGANTSDWLPVIGESRRLPGFFFLFVGLGFTLGPLCARLLSEVMLGRSPSLPVEAFSPARF